MKTAVIVLSDPKQGEEEALGRVFNALAVAYEYKQAGDDVTVQFQGAGTRWIDVLNNAEHPAHTLFDEVKDKVAGVSCGCADVFGGREEAESAGFKVLTDNAVPGTSGLPSLRSLIADGYSILTF